MNGMFRFATSFNQPLNNWNVSNVIDMYDMFYNATSFNQPLNSWDVSKVTNMWYMFSSGTSFNQDISNWNVSNVTNMDFMFSNATSFNQDISNWEVSNVTDMGFMFSEATSFNQDISNWDVSNVIDMDFMFIYATSFNQDLSNWNISNVEFMQNMFEGVTLSTEYYSNMLNAWSKLPLQNNVVFNGGNSKYYIDAQAARQSIIDNYGWTITDGGLVTSITENQINNIIEIYPNPSNGKVFVKSNSEIINIYITDISGKQLYNNNYKSELKTEIDLSKYPSGIY